MQAVQVCPEPYPTRDCTQHHRIPLGGTREGRDPAQEASPWPSPLVDSEFGYEERGIFP